MKGVLSNLSYHAITRVTVISRACSAFENLPCMPGPLRRHSSQKRQAGEKCRIGCPARDDHVGPFLERSN